MNCDMVEILDVVLSTPKCLPVLFIGPPGSAKTSRAGQYARLVNRRIHTVLGSIREPSDFCGIPVATENGVEFFPPKWARDAQGTNDIIFLDELNTAAPATMAAMLRVTLDRVVGDMYLGDHVGIVAACNPVAQAAGGWDLPDALNNRFIHIPVTYPTADEFTGYMMGDHSQNYSRVQFTADEWEAEFNVAKSYVGGFLKRRPSLIAENPEASKGFVIPSFATPRTWECVTRLIATCRAAKRMHLLEILLNGTIGERVATEFFKWMTEADLPDPEYLINNPNTHRFDAGRPDKTFAIMLSVVAVCRNVPVTSMPVFNAGTESASDRDKARKRVLADRWKNCWTIANNAANAGSPEIAYIATRTLLTDPDSMGAITPEITEFVKKVSPITGRVSL